MPTGTNLLGLVKHKAHSEFVCFGDTFKRPSGEPLTGFQSAEPNADMWATSDESRQEIVELCQRAWTYSDATIDALPLESNDNMPPADRAWCDSYRDRLQRVAEAAGGD